MSSLRFSTSSLNSFKRCPKCFYLDKVLDIKQPEGIRAGVPMGIDRVIKEHFDAHRAAGAVPPELIGKIPGGLYPGDRISMPDLRNWRKGLSVFIDGIELSTALDDLLFNPETKIYNMIDAKSKAKLTNEAETRKYYQTQANAYDFALNVNNYPTDGDAFFAYYSPIHVDQSDPTGRVAFRWNCQIVKIKANHEEIKQLLRGAAACVSSAMPAPSPDCEYCDFVAARAEMTKAVA